MRLLLFPLIFSCCSFTWCKLNWEAIEAEDNRLYGKTKRAYMDYVMDLVLKNKKPILDETVLRPMRELINEKCGLDLMQVYILLVPCILPEPLYESEDQCHFKHGNLTYVHYIRRCTINDLESEACRFRDMNDVGEHGTVTSKKNMVKTSDGRQIHVRKTITFINCEYKTNRTVTYFTLEERLDAAHLTLGIYRNETEKYPKGFVKNYVDRLAKERVEAERKNDEAYRNSEEFLTGVKAAKPFDFHQWIKEIGYYQFFHKLFALVFTITVIVYFGQIVYDIRH